MLDCLSGEERARAARLRTTEARLQFIVMHGAVRTILARYLAIAPADLRIETAASGKPVLAGTHLAHSTAHSEGLGLCAVAWGGSIGVDVERIRPAPDAGAIVRRYFAPGEIAQFERCPSAERIEAFYSLWTRKEAYLKAAGEGLQIPLDSFEVELAPRAEFPRLVDGRPDAARPPFHLRALSPSPGYTAAIALDCAIGDLQIIDWSARGPVSAASTSAARRDAPAGHPPRGASSSG